MDRNQVAKQIEKLLSRLLFDKKGVKIDVIPLDKGEPRHYEFPSYKKYIIDVHVNPYKFNNVTDDFDQSYYDFITNIDDIVDKNVKYLGVEPDYVVVRYIIDDQDKFISMMENIIYDKWPEVEREFIRNIDNRALLDEPELTEVTIRQRGPRYPEFTLYLGTKAKEQGGNEQKQRISNELLWNAVQEKLPVGEMFLELV
jgi:hypothetical protein